MNFLIDERDIKLLIKKCNKYRNEPLYRNSLAIMLNSFFSSLFGLLFWIVAARNIPPNEIGLATASTSVALLLISLSKLGLDIGLIRYLPESSNKNRLYSTVLLVILLLVVTINIIYIAGIGIFSPALELLFEWKFLIAYFVYIISMSIYSIQNITLIAIRRADLSLIQNLALGSRVLIIFFIPFLNALGIISSLGISLVFAILLGSALLSHCELSFNPKVKISNLKEISRFSFESYIGDILSMLPATIVPLLILNTIGSQASAHFYIAYSIASLLFMIPHSVSMSLLVEGSHNSPIKENIIKSVKIIMVFLIPIVMAIFFYGDHALYIFSKEYSEQSFGVLKLLVASSLFYSIISVYQAIKRIKKEIKIINYINFAISIMIVGFGYIALLKYGIIGIGYAWLWTNLIICILILAFGRLTYSE